MRENVIVKKSFAFSVRIVNLNKYLSQEKKEYVISKQIYKSGTSIGANVAEAQKAQSTADFVAKMKIALKEANETQYGYSFYMKRSISQKRNLQVYIMIWWRF